MELIFPFTTNNECRHVLALDSSVTTYFISYSATFSECFLKIIVIIIAISAFLF